MIAHIEKAISYPVSVKLLFAANVGSLLFALVMQYGFDVFPCILCLWQRVPYGSAAILALIAILWKPNGKKAAVILGLCSAIYLSGMGVAAFHTGVERLWWAGTSGCTVHPLQGGSPEELRKSLLQTVSTPCDEITWSIFGLTMANLNIVASLAMALFTAVAAATAAARSARE